MECCARRTPRSPSQSLNCWIDFCSLFVRLAWYNTGMSLKLYMVTCDLRQTDDYQSLRARLLALDARQLLNAQWALRSTYTATELRDLLRAFLHEGDRIVVTEVGHEWASRKAMSNLGQM